MMEKIVLFSLCIISTVPGTHTHLLDMEILLNFNKYF